MSDLNLNWTTFKTPERSKVGRKKLRSYRI